MDTNGDTDWDLPSDLDVVVRGVKQEFGTKYIFVWHGICGYWAGVGTPETTVDTPEMRSLESTIVRAEPTPGLLEVEPSMGWNPASLAGVGVVKDPANLYSQMHTYLSS